VLGENGVIKGNLSCENADIAGSFSGNLNVSQLLTLRSTANIKGDVVVGKLSVEPGAAFNATCRMQPGDASQSKANQSTVYDRPDRSSVKAAEQLN
jgi:cytoskeletal protein CcmA (bactofilin family)